MVGSRCNVICLIWVIRSREVSCRVQGIDDTAGHLWSTRCWSGGHRRHCCPVLEEVRASHHGHLLLLKIVLLIVPAPFLGQFAVKEADSPSSFFLDLVEDFKNFLLFSTDN